MLTEQEWVEMGERIDCTAPLPEDPVGALLAEMLVPVPYKVPEIKAEKKAAGTWKGLRREAAPDASPEDAEAHSSHEGEERKKKAASTQGAEESKKVAAGTRKGSRCKAVIESSFEDDEEDPPPPKTGENMKRCPLPVLGRRRKGRPPHQGRPGHRRREKHPFPITPLPPLSATRSGCPGASPGRGRKYPHSIILSVRL